MCSRPSPVSSVLSPAGPQPGSEEPPAPPDLPATPILWPCLDRLGFTQAIGGLVLGLIALFTTYDHVTLAGRYIPIPQQWGIPLIAASVATVVVDAQLATRSRLRAAQDSARAADEAARERDLAAEARKRQAEGFERLDQAALLSGRVQLDPTSTNRARFQFFLTLLAQSAMWNR
jgi:hypothetical protein